MRIDGKQIAAEIFEELKRRVGELKEKNLPAGRQGIVPHLVIILIGEDPASVAYVRQKKLKGEEIGAKVTVMNYESGITNKELIKTIKQLNNDNNVHGIIVQRPLPEHIDSTLINQSVDPKKDVDAFHSQTKFEIPLAKAVIYILEHIFRSNIKSDQDFIDWLKSKSIVVIGKGETGGGPTIKLLKKIGIEPITVDSKTQNPDQITAQADIIVCAVGKAGVLNPQAIKKGVILIAVGMYKGEDGRLHGDYEEENVKHIAGFYTPVPGGIGPVNVAMLLKNLVLASEHFPH